MKILNINAISTGQSDIALPYETDEHVQSAWEYIFRRHCVNVRPEADVDDQDPAMLEHCAEAFREGKQLHLPNADQGRRLIAAIRQNEMSHDVRELFDPTSGVAAAPHEKNLSLVCQTNCPAYSVLQQPASHSPLTWDHRTPGGRFIRLGAIMRCIPEEPDFGDGRIAEGAVWAVLKAQLPDDVVLAHSVQVRDGRAEHEIDILVLWPGVGMAAIEVKGGKVGVENGQWYQSDKAGAHNIQSPVVQSQASMHAFKSWLEDELGSRLSSRFAYLVSLPYTDVPQGWAMAGCPRSLILDRADTESLKDKVRHAIEREGSGATNLTPAFQERIVRKLGGDLDAGSAQVPDPHEAEDAQDNLTVRQAVLLRATRSVPRVRFTGGAGSGKTWLALEKARLLCKQGKRVGLFCYNKGLSQYLQLQVEGWRQAKPVFTGEFHEYVRGLGVPDGTGTDYFEEQMPRLLKELGDGMQPHERLDAVVVDEAQDFAPLWWESLLACTTDPVAGEVYAFMDDRQDVYQRWTGAGSDGKHPTADLVPIHIDENLRNTIKIAETFRGFAGEHFTLRGGTGLPVRRVACDTEDALDAADECVEALMDEGWSPNQIALLTTKSRHPVHQERFDAGSIAEYWLDFHANNDVFYGHVLGFKGLERSAVVLCVNGFKDMERAAEQLYVGLSRARTLLVVVGDSGLLESVGGRDLKLALARAEAWQPATLSDQRA